ncbi:MAG: hypothetical protein C4532_13965 [Candidatus Abyssobacteria bacterium SURF_17]|jgi:hypothetical protein|uniref:Uncharacterized protein n=1 Tax=Candidatus Abyssobacteria bacterium SURF_17 TaxID=2093361 RepID=A0A419EUD5_9BACT|nr:MAG: hypothetical protein C4532_13965 [Candidatus Abyssubacteria bacterium SURF_17]
MSFLCLFVTPLLGREGFSMRANMSHVKLAIIALAVAFASCGRGEEQKNNGAFGEAPKFLQETIRDISPRAETPHESAKRGHGDEFVSLKPPYTDWKTTKDDPEPRISLQNAARALCVQAGKQYDFESSLRNTDPICRQWVYLSIDDKPWEEAMEELLAPFNITYVVRDNTVALIKPKDLEKLEQEMQDVASEFTHFDSPGTQPPRFHDEQAGKTANNNIMFSLVPIVTAVPIIAMCIPLLMGKIGMNSIYGVRIKKAYESEENWYKINRYGAQRLILWCVVYTVIGILTLFLPPIGTRGFILFIGIGPIVFIGIIPVIEILLYARKL